MFLYIIKPSWLSRNNISDLYLTNCCFFVSAVRVQALPHHVLQTGPQALARSYLYPNSL